MTDEERDALLQHLVAGQDKHDALLQRLVAGQDELRVYVKAMARKLLAPAEIAEIEAEVAIAAD